MKKTISYILINIFFTVLVFAQEETTTGSSATLVNKKGVAILPAGGDFALGVDAHPFLDYAGNLFSGSTYENTLDLGGLNIYGRYFNQYYSSYRFNFRVNNGIAVDKRFVQDDAAVLVDPLTRDQVIDKQTRYYNSWMVSIGYQKYRGYGRLKGFYGAVIGYGQSRTQYEYQYGNEMTVANQSPTSFTWNMYRELKRDNGLNRDIDVGPVVGVEFYFAPKMCIGAEVNVNYNISIGTESDYVYQEWADGQVQEVTIENGPGNLSRNLRSYSFGAYSGMYLMFCF